MSKTTNKYSPEVRERAVRMLLSNEGQHESRWSAILSVSGKIGCAAQTLNGWVKGAGVDSGQRGGVTTEMPDKGSLIDVFARRSVGWRAGRTASAGFVLPSRQIATQSPAG